MRLKHIITVKNGKYTLQNPELFKKDVQRLEGKPAYLAVGELKKNRSGNQNRYYWGIVVEILSNELGYTPDEIHEILKSKFLMKKTIMLDNSEEFKIAHSTTKLSTKEFEEYAKNIRVWSAIELEIQIPEPNELDFN